MYIEWYGHMYRSPDWNCVLKMYHLCLPPLCTSLLYDTFWVYSLDQEICTYHSTYTRKGKIFPSPFAYLHRKVAPLLTIFVIYPLCSLSAFCSDVTSQLFSREGGGASDPKKQTYTTRFAKGLGPYTFGLVSAMNSNQMGELGCKIYTQWTQILNHGTGTNQCFVWRSSSFPYL